MNRPVVLLLGPHRAAVSGVSTHLNLLMDSALDDDFELAHFQVGSEGRDEGPLGRLLRLAVSPFALFVTILPIFGKSKTPRPTSVPPYRSRLPVMALMTSCSQ